MVARAKKLAPRSRTSPERDVAVKMPAATRTPATLPESSGGKSLYDVLTTEDINRETGLSKPYIQGKCKSGEIRCITKGGGLGQGHGYRVMRKDFIEWWDRQYQGGNPSLNQTR